MRTTIVFVLAAVLLPAACAPGEEAPAAPSAIGRLARAFQEGRESLPFELHGFQEAALGWLPAKNRLIRNHSFNLMESRTQLKTLYYPEFWEPLVDRGTALSVKADFVGDGISEDFMVEFRSEEQTS